MVTESRLVSSLELWLDGTDDTWPAEIEAQGADHLRVRLVPVLGELPLFQNGAGLSCALEDDSGRYSASARVLSQNGPTLWLNVDAQWRKGGRRTSPRVAGGFSISFQADEITGVGLCINVSAGGMRVRIGRELPPSVPITVIFRLPQQKSAILASAKVMYQREVGEGDNNLEVGLKFVDIPIAQASRLAAYCRNV